MSDTERWVMLTFIGGILIVAALLIGNMYAAIVCAWLTMLGVIRTIIEWRERP